MGTWFLASWYTHRKAVSWAWRGLRVAALIAGTVTVGLWFGVVLGLVAWALPALILWPLLRREEQRSGSTPEPVRLDGTLRLGFAFAAIVAALVIVYGSRL